MKKMESCHAKFERVVDICYLGFKHRKWKNHVETHWEFPQTRLTGDI